MPEKLNAYLDPNLPIVERVDDLVSRMTLEEKVSQMIHNSPAIERLGIPRYNWWNECLHGVARMRIKMRPRIATVFPQAIGMAASFDLDLFAKVASVISDEARAIHHDCYRKIENGEWPDDEDEWPNGLTYWSPNINIFRDPRWGRGQETYGECPYLTSRFGVTFVKGLQGDDPDYLKLVSTPKHYAVHSGPEPDRHKFDAVVSEKDLRETYLPAFEACVREAGAYSVMGAYNRTNGEACCASPTLLQKILRDEWGFDGYVVSDCWAIGDIYKHHKIVETMVEASAMAVRAGCDLNCGDSYPALLGAVEKGLITEDEIDISVKRLFTARFRLGMFDPPERVRWAHIPMSVVSSDEHRELALKMARESIVLLKNQGNILPLGKAIGSIAVIGPNADDALALKGNYYGDSEYSVTPLAGIQNAVSENTKVLYAKGCEHTGNNREGFRSAIDIASKSDVAVVVLGLTNRIEGEEGETSDPESGPDRAHICLPKIQEALLKEIHKTRTPVVLVLIGGSAPGVSWADENVDAILMAWYPGMEGGTAVADVLFGDYNPAGRLPVTIYSCYNHLPPFDDYSMKNRTYRYFEGDPLYQFGYGLSYTSFEYSDLGINPDNPKPDEPVTVTFNLKNTGDVAGDEVAQVYLSWPDSGIRTPRQQLAGFERVHLAHGEVKSVEIIIDPYWLKIVDENGHRICPEGKISVSVGGGQPGDDKVSITLSRNIRIQNNN